MKSLIQFVVYLNYIANVHNRFCIAVSEGIPRPSKQKKKHIEGGLVVVR